MSTPPPTDPPEHDEGLTGLTAEPVEEGAPMDQTVEEDLAIDEVKTRAVRATGGLLTRQVVMRGLDFAGMIVLARVLTPEMFGIFAIVRFVVFFFERFSDFGLSATLLRKAEAVTEGELRTVFTIQNTIVLLSLAVIWTIAPFVVGHYEALGPEHVALVRTLGLGLVLSSLKTIPAVLVQRQLRHEKLAVIDVLEVLVYQVVTVSLAVAGLGVWALVWGTLSRGVVGVVLVYSIAWWRPMIGFSREAAREIASFGVPIQLGSFVTLARDAVVPVFVGTVLGAAAVGFVNWARTMMGTAVGQPLNLMGKVQMRVFGRVQNESGRLTRAIERNIFLGASLVGLSLALLVSLAEPFVLYVIQPKWLPALPVLYLLGFAFAINVVTNPYVQALKALGEGWTTFWNQILNVIGLLGGFAVLNGSTGLLAYGFAFIASQAFVGIHASHRLHKHVRPRWWASAWPPVLASALAGAVGVLVSRAVPDLFGLFLGGAAVVPAYVIVLGVLAGDRLGDDVRDIAAAVGGKSPRVSALAERVRSLLHLLHRRPGLSSAA